MSEIHAQTVPYVRDTMLPQSEPPVSQRGVAKWMHENLFSSWLNATLTILSLAAIWSIVLHLAPWFYHTVWNASSLSECREIRNATGGQDASSACFAVINDRWQQLFFGFYPSDERWRPVLALIIFLAGLAPILFDHLPRKLLAFSVISPLLCYMLIWGGSIWGPLAFVLGFGVAYAVYRVVASINNLAATVAAILAIVLYWLFLAQPLAAVVTAALPIGLEFVPSRAFGGFTLSVVIGLSAIVLSLPLGIVLALARKSDMPIIKYSAVVFIEVIRGIPLIVWLFTASLILNYFTPPGSSPMDLLLRVIIVATLFSAAYIAEVIRGGLAALPKGQYEAADALGLDYWKSMRLIILPQALKISIPGIVNTFIGLFKDTTLVLFIGLLDPMGLTKSIRSDANWNGVYWELYVFIAALFFIFCFSMGRYSLYLEKKLQREHR